jgi:hypothetical protein
MGTPKESVGHRKPAVKPDQVQKYKGGDRQKPPTKAFPAVLPVCWNPPSRRKKLTTGA